MGNILQANCKKCGYIKSDIYFGGGMQDFTSVCNVPAYNKKTKRLVVKNYFAENKEHYFFYNNPVMFKGKIGVRAHQWEDVFLKDRNNFCPQCKNYSLSFSCTALFD